MKSNYHRNTYIHQPKIPQIALNFFLLYWIEFHRRDSFDQSLSCRSCLAHHLHKYKPLVFQTIWFPKGKSSNELPSCLPFFCLFFSADGVWSRLYSCPKQGVFAQSAHISKYIKNRSYQKLMYVVLIRRNLNNFWWLHLHSSNFEIRNPVQ